MRNLKTNFDSDKTIVCQRCVMDTSASEITFDESGFCNFCNELVRKNRNKQDTKSTADIHRDLLRKIKADGKGRSYDCVVGVSGGVDSSWVLVNAVENGLRPLAVHMDNGWNSDLAQRNIENLVKGLNVDLYTYVVDWQLFKDAQEAFFEADVIDIELLTDNLLISVNFRKASELGLKHILSGSNTATEGIAMPHQWAAETKLNKSNILRIWKTYGKQYQPSRLPVVSLSMFYYFRFIRRITWHRYLDLIIYEKARAISELNRRFSYIPYPYKHYESIFTRFYQGYILPKKFGVDKRKNHLSALILNGEISRESALADLRRSPYSGEDQLKQDMQYFLKKLSWDMNKLDEYIARPGKPHALFGSDIDILHIPRLVHRGLIGN